MARCCCPSHAKNQLHSICATTGLCNIALAAREEGSQIRPTTPCVQRVSALHKHQLQEHLFCIAAHMLNVVQCCKDRHTQQQNTSYAAAGTPPLPPTVLTTRVPSLSTTFTT